MDRTKTFTQSKVELLDERSLDVSKPPLFPADDRKPELPRPDPSSIVAPMYHGAAEAFSSDPLLICPTIPISE